MVEPAIRHIRIILCGTTHPGNIGAAARAMKAMGIHSLYLVRPKMFPSADATARAAGADDILENAVLCEDLHEAVGNCTLVFGTSARERSIAWRNVTPEEAAGQASAGVARSENIAFVFGRESIGLTNEELDLCNRKILIPCDPVFSSLNLAAAVQVICYEVRKAMQDPDKPPEGKAGYQPVTAEDMVHFYEHLEQTLIETGFLDPAKPRRLMRRMRALFNRADPDRNEYNILRGILTAIQEKIDNGKK